MSWIKPVIFLVICAGFLNIHAEEGTQGLLMMDQHAITWTADQKAAAKANYKQPDAATLKKRIKEKAELRAKASELRSLQSLNQSSPIIANTNCAGNCGVKLFLPTSDVTTIGPNFTAFTYADQGFVPPDPNGGVGPTQFIGTTFSFIRSFDKTTGLPDGILNESLDLFFAPVLGGGFIDEARIRYDHSSDRWFVTALDRFPPSPFQPYRVVIAVSNSGIITNATTDWKFNFFYPYPFNSPLPSIIPDFPTLGIDHNALYIGLNILAPLFNTEAFVIPKQRLIQKNHLRVFGFFNLIDSSGEGPFSPQGVDNFDSLVKDGVFVGTDQGTTGRLALRLITNPAAKCGPPEISDNIFLTVPTFAQPISPVPSQGSLLGLDGFDDRLSSSHIRGEFLYTSHSVGVNNNGVSLASTDPTLSPSRNGCRWYQISLRNPMLPCLKQAGTMFAPSISNDLLSRSFWIPGIMTNGLNTMVLGSSTSGAFAFAIRFSNDPKGLIRDPLLYTASTTPYNLDNLVPNLWGFYSNASVDPSDGMTLWTIQEFCNATNSWGTQAVRILAQPPASVKCASPQALKEFHKDQLLTIHGMRIQGSAFFDPGPGFPNHLTVAIEGLDVTEIKSVTPTEIKLHVSAGKSDGLKTRTITITNPDGQSIVSEIKLCIVSHRPVD